jgi:hypothetical protein
VKSGCSARASAVHQTGRPDASTGSTPTGSAVRLRSARTSRRVAIVPSVRGRVVKVASQRPARTASSEEAPAPAPTIRGDSPA